jgi:hypothetical protein
MTDDALIEAMARAMCEVGELDPDDWWECLRSDAKAALAAIRKTHAVVPKSPSAEMIVAGDKAFETFDPLYPAVIVYRAMLAASEETRDDR